MDDVVLREQTGKAATFDRQQGAEVCRVALCYIKGSMQIGTAGTQSGSGGFAPLVAGAVVVGLQNVIETAIGGVSIVDDGVVVEDDDARFGLSEGVHGGESHEQQSEKEDCRAGSNKAKGFRKYPPPLSYKPYVLRAS